MGGLRGGGDGERPSPGGQEAAAGRRNDSRRGLRRSAAEKERAEARALLGKLAAVRCDCEDRDTAPRPDGLGGSPASALTILSRWISMNLPSAVDRRTASTSAASGEKANPGRELAAREESEGQDDESASPGEASESSTTRRGADKGLELPTVVDWQSTGQSRNFARAADRRDRLAGAMLSLVGEDKGIHGKPLLLINSIDPRPVARPSTWIEQ